MAQTISALADRVGVRPDTLRYYEQLGLLHPSGRTAAGYRLYDEAAAERLAFIRGAKRVGLRLADIKELLAVSDRGQCPCGHTKLLVERRLAEVESEIKQLQGVRRQLEQLKARNEACLVASPAEWPCEVGIQGGGE